MAPKGRCPLGGPPSDPHQPLREWAPGCGGDREASRAQRRSGLEGQAGRGEVRPACSPRQPFSPAALSVASPRPWALFTVAAALGVRWGRTDRPLPRAGTCPLLPAKWSTASPAPDPSFLICKRSWSPAGRPPRLVLSGRPRGPHPVPSVGSPGGGGPPGPVVRPGVLPAVPGSRAAGWTQPWCALCSGACGMPAGCGSGSARGLPGGGGARRGGARRPSSPRLTGPPEPGPKPDSAPPHPGGARVRLALQGSLWCAPRCLRLRAPVLQLVSPPNSRSPPPPKGPSLLGTPWPRRLPSP